MKKLVLLCCLAFLSLCLQAQVFGGNPPSLKWNQINTDTVRIIFPEGMDSTAQRISNVVHYLAKNNPAKLGTKFKKINIVLQTQTTIANGYVSLAPYRSEFQMTPVLNNFELGSINWADALAVHEYRHVQQFINFRNGLSSLLYYLFGESGWLVGINASVPDWFFEGDAVYNETVTTNQGRGRIPFFQNEYKSLWTYNKNYSWMKLRNGSFKDYVPNHYPLGYLLVNYGREKYGLDFWSGVTKDASAFKGLFYPFQHAIKKHTGISYKEFRKDAIDYYKLFSGTKDSIANRNFTTGIQNITPLNKKYVTDYTFPYQMENGSLIYSKSSYRHLEGFYVRNGNNEKKLRVKDIAINQQFSYRNGKIVYAAYEPAARWGWKDYSVIRILDVQTNKQQSIGRKTKYFEPDISPDGKTIAAVEILPGGQSELHLLDLSGKVIQHIHSKDISLFTTPKFIDDSSIVTAVRLNDGRMALAIVHNSSGVIERLSPPSYGVIGHVSVNNGNVYFTASYSGNDELYALRLIDKKVFRLAQTSLGNYYVNGSTKKLVWSGFTPEGYQLREMDLAPGKWIEVTDSTIMQPVETFPIAHENELPEILLKEVPNRSFPQGKYSQGAHLFYLHSWRPYYADPEFSYSLYSDNILNNFSNEFYYLYNQNETSHSVGWAGAYGALFPIINTGVEYTLDRTVETINNVYTEDRFEARIGYDIPLNFTKGRTFKYLNFGSDFVYSHRMPTGIFKDSLETVSKTYLRHFLSWSQFVPLAVQHIFPKFGYSFSANLRHWLTSDYGFMGNAQWLFNGQIFLPSINNHSIVLTASYQKVDTNSYTFSNRFALSRGYEDYYFQKMWRLSANYHFPIVYPDWGFANLLYFSRLRGNIFYDYSTVYTGGFSKDELTPYMLRSTGAELYFDTKWWNAYPLTFGIRWSYLIDADLVGAGKSVFEVLVPIVIPD
jgi:hypothetical protein